MTALVVTYLYPALPKAHIAKLEAGLRDGCLSTEDRPGLDLRLDADDSPLGGEAFVGTIPQDTTPANRAALLGIVSRHGARIALHVNLPDQRDATHRQALRLALRASQTLARRHPPQAVLWGPTGLLMQRAALDALSPDIEPLSLFVSVMDEATGPRRVPSLAFDGARLWIGQDLHARLCGMPRDVVRRAALAFLTAARHNPDLVRGQSFHHAGQSYRIAHAPEVNRIDLIPAAQAPLAIRPQPGTGLRPAGPSAA